MPSAGYAEGSVFLWHAQASKFETRRPLGRLVTDGNGREWLLEEGVSDGDERNFGLFDGTTLVARLSIVSPLVTAADCPTPFWSVGRIEVADAFQGIGLGSGMIIAVSEETNLPIASDVDQSAGGAAMWRRIVRAGEKRVELHGADGSLGPIVNVDGTLVPDPWQRRDLRLVCFS